LTGKKGWRYSPILKRVELHLRRHAELRIINRLIRTQNKFDGKKEYKLYTYEVGATDHYGTDEVDDLKLYETGQRVEVYFDAQYNKPKMRLYKSVRNITIDKDNRV